jgi:hypothetical protein
MPFGGMGFKMQIKPFNSEALGAKWQHGACDSKCHSVAWGSKCELNCSIVSEALGTRGYGTPPKPRTSNRTHPGSVPCVPLRSEAE